MESLSVLFLKAGLPDPEQAAKFLKVNRTTISRWRSGSVDAPHSVYELLHIMAGNPPGVAKQSWFNGWRFNGEFFISPENVKFTEGDIRSVRPLMTEVASLRTEIRRLTDENRKLSSKLQDLQKPEKLPDNVVQFPGRLSG